MLSMIQNGTSQAEHENKNISSINEQAQYSCKHIQSKGIMDEVSPVITYRQNNKAQNKKGRSKRISTSGRRHRVHKWVYAT